MYLENSLAFIQAGGFLLLCLLCKAPQVRSLNLLWLWLVYEACVNSTLYNKLIVNGLCELLRIDAPRTPYIDNLQDIKLLLWIQFTSILIEKCCQSFEEIVLEESPEFWLNFLDFTSLDQSIGEVYVADLLVCSNWLEAFFPDLDQLWAETRRFLTALHEESACTHNRVLCWIKLFENGNSLH